MCLKKVENPEDWKFNFYVVNKRQEFVYGFDDRTEARLYAYILNKKRHRSNFKVMSFAEAMSLSATLTPEYEDSWTDSYVEPDDLTKPDPAT